MYICDMLRDFSHTTRTADDDLSLGEFYQVRPAPRIEAEWVPTVPVLNDPPMAIPVEIPKVTSADQLRQVAAHLRQTALTLETIANGMS